MKDLMLGLSLKKSWKARRTVVLSFLIFTFFFRFLFGLYCPSITEDDDEVQTYLIGLKSYTTQTWPYFGPDNQGGGVQKGQMPGALEGLLIRIPLEIWHAPEAPYLFLDILTFLAFGFLAWYCCRRLPKLSPWFVFGSIYILPWTTHFSVTIVNPSYSIVGAILFWIGFFESFPPLAIGVISIGLANALMGFGFIWVMQLHLSWVMLPPFLLSSFYFQWKAGTWKKALWFGILGSLPVLVLLIPTFIQYGFWFGQEIQKSGSLFSSGNASKIFDLLARYFSFACFELPRFIGEHTHDRISYLVDSPWIMPAGFFLWAVGILQALVMFFFLFRRSSNRDWNFVRWTTLGLFFVLYFAFLFSRKPPSSHRYYEALPVAVIYSFYCWEVFAGKTFWRKLAVFLLAIALYFQIGYAVKAAASGVSIYSQYRARMTEAIQAKNYRLLAERRESAIY